MLQPVFLLAFSLLLLSANASQAKCPVINGKYSFIEKRPDKDIRHSITLFTRQEAGVFSYTIDKEGTFQVADGVARSIPFKDGAWGKYSYSCDEGTLIANSQADGSNTIYIYEISVLSKTEIKVQSNIPGRDGIYTKQ